MRIQSLAFRKAGAILFYKSSTSTSKKGKERYEYNIITTKKLVEYFILYEFKSAE